MTTYTVTDRTGKAHTVRADRYSPNMLDHGAVYNFFTGDVIVATFTDPVSVVTQSKWSDPLRTRTSAQFVVQGHPGDVERLLRAWASRHGYTFEALHVGEL